jgi:hypothetical protein
MHIGRLIYGAGCETALAICGGMWLIGLKRAKFLENVTSSPTCTWKIAYIYINLSTIFLSK